MRRRKGYTKKVLEAQIKKYESVLAWKDARIANWIDGSTGFGNVDNCPVCSFRWHLHPPLKPGCFISGVNQCLAVNSIDQPCYAQEWYGRLRMIRTTSADGIKRARQILKARLKYWQKIYVEKYPGKS